MTSRATDDDHTPALLTEAEPQPVRPLRLSDFEAAMAAHDRGEEYVRPEVVEVIDREVRDAAGNVVATWTHYEYAQPRTDVERNNRDMMLCRDAQSHCRGEPDEQAAIEQYILGHGGDERTIECSRQLRATKERLSKPAEPPAAPLTPAQAELKRAKDEECAHFGQRCYCGTTEECEAAMAADRAKLIAAVKRRRDAEASCGPNGEWVRGVEWFRRRSMIERRDAALARGAKAAFAGAPEPFAAYHDLQRELDRAANRTAAADLLATGARVRRDRERAVAAAAVDAAHTCWRTSAPPPTRPPRATHRAHASNAHLGFAAVDHAYREAA